MITIEIETTGGSYPVFVGTGLLQSEGAWSLALGEGKLLILSDENVAPLYLDPLLRAMGDRKTDCLVLPPGEDQKSFENWRRVIDRLIGLGALRDATVVALGGGVIGDLAGFAAASYMRGVRFVQAPTTLLAQVDASVGGKTAINHPAGKNLIGAFHQPAAVIIDSTTLDTLPPREYRAGLAEVVKYGAIRDVEFLAWLEAHVDDVNARHKAVVLEMIRRSVRHKAEIVARDEREQGVRALLNFGHTFAHALETCTGFRRYLHGEAVAIGMVAAATLSENTGLCPSGCATHLARLLEALGLETGWPGDIEPEAALNAMAMDKKALHSGLRLILLDDLGKARIHPSCDRRDILRAIQSRL